MTVSYEFLKKQLMKAEMDVDLNPLGFEEFERLSDRMESELHFERLWVAKNKQGLEIVVLDLGNTHIEVIGFLKEFIEKGEVFIPEEYGHLATYTNKDYYDEEKQKEQFIEYVLNPSPEGVRKMHEFKK